MAGTFTLEQALSRLAREGELYERLPEGRVRCFACGHRCLILPGQKGICKVRWNEDGRLIVPTGYVAALQLDPVEKKPFFHAYPGSRALSFGMLGCDYHCGYCFAEDTMIATERGFVPIGKIFEGAALTSDEAVRVPEMRVITAGGMSRPVVKAFRHPYRGPLAIITPYYFPALRCTPDHRILATKDPMGDRLEEVRAGDLTTEHWLVVPKPVPSGGPVLLDAADLLGDITPTFAVPRSLTPNEVGGIMAASQSGVSSRTIGSRLARNPSYIRHVRSKVRRGVWVYEQVRGLEEEGERVRFHKEHRPGIPRWVQLDKPLARLLGYFCAEGSVCRSRVRPNSLTLTFSFGPPEASARDEVISLLRDVFGVTPRVSHRATTTAVEVGKSSLAWLFARLCGEGAAHKQVPSILFEADPSLRETFLDAYVAGDGHLYANGKVSVTTVSPALAYGVAWLALQTGCLPAVYASAVGAEREIQGRVVHPAPIQYTVVWYRERRGTSHYQETDRWFLIPIKSVATEPFEGHVYNLEVEEDHSYLAGFFAVKNCQNWLTSQALRDPVAGVPPQEMTPREIVNLAFQHRARILTSTYNEPLITSEWAVEVFKEGKARGLTCSYVSNGNATPEVLDYIRPWVDLYKVDLKGFDDKHYRKLGGVLKVVLDSIRLLHRKGFWLEIVTLVIPGFNDSDEELKDIAKFLVSVSTDIPWHATAFHQDYKMTDRENTTAKTLIRAAEIGVAEGLRYVYAGNLPGRVGPFENTYCPSCKTALIERVGYIILKDLLTPSRGVCPSCSTKIPGVWG